MDVRSRADDIVSGHRAAPGEFGDDLASVKAPKNTSTDAIRSSPPVLVQERAMNVDSAAYPADTGDKSDSEAETIVLSGKDGHSPPKIRKSIKHEDNSEDENKTFTKQNNSGFSKESSSHTRRASDPTSAASTLGKRKRQKRLDHPGDASHHGNSSGLSSVPTSPVATTRSSLSKPAASDSEISRSPSPRPRSAARDKAKPLERAPARKRQLHETDSGDDDDIEERRSGRPRSGTKATFDTKSQKAARSQSPQARGHRRSISTQLPAKSSQGLSHKKRRIPAPLQSTEYPSDDSSGSGTSLPRSSRLRSLAAPNTGDSNMSPIKMAPHRKHVNPSGQTQFARACGQNKLDVAIQKLEEFPDDLNRADHAGNTPLHAASLAGFVDIVKFLLSTPKCEIDPLNVAKDTPLIDALENCHVDVVKLLLDAGANPRKLKADGKDLLDIIAENIKDAKDNEDDEAVETWAKMNKLVAAAIKKFIAAPQDSEDDRTQDNTDSRLSNPIDSPRHTPPIPSREFSNPNTTTRRVGVGTSRQVKTRDGNLYQPMNLNELRKAAKDGDVNSTGRILEVMGMVNDAKSVWLAARGGYHELVNLHLAMGGFDVNSPPLEDIESGKDTPFLVAIGRDKHLQVLKLFLDQSNFDPTRLVNGETYYDIARKRRGSNWQEEVALLKDAYNKYKPPKTSPGNSRSPGSRRDLRDNDRDVRRPARKDEEHAARSQHKRTTSSPKIKEYDSIQVRRRRNSSIERSKDKHLQKRGPGRPRKEESAVVLLISDRENSPVMAKKQTHHPKRSESDVTVASDTENTTKPRRKLVSGKEFRGERDLDKQRRASIVSNSSTASIKDKRERIPAASNSEKPEGRTSLSIPRSASKNGDHDDIQEKPQHDKDRARSLKRDDSKDRLNAIRGESPIKRPRKSDTPPRSGAPQDNVGSAPKRRRLEGNTERKADRNSTTSPESHVSKPKSSLSRDNSAARSVSDVEHKFNRLSKPHPQMPGELSQQPQSEEFHLSHSNSSAKRSHTSSPDLLGKRIRAASAERPDDAVEESLASMKSAKEDAAREEQVRRNREEEEARIQQAENEKLQSMRIAEAKQQRLLKEQAAREEQEARDREEAEQKELQRREEAEARARQAEQQRMLYLEQERLKKEEQERRRAILLEQQRAEKARLEKLKEEERLSKLPLLLRWFDMLEDATAPEIASQFASIPGYRLDTIDPGFKDTPSGREQWMLNVNVAILLGEKDLQLSRYTAWERIHLTDSMKRAVWRTQNGWYLLRNFSLPVELRRHFPPSTTPPHIIESHNRALFCELDLFFVKVTEFMYAVPRFPHLRGIEMNVLYSELTVPSNNPSILPIPKWKSDPDASEDQRFAPYPKCYVNGSLVRKLEPSRTQLLNAPPKGNNRVPRRDLVQVFPGDPDYEEICQHQGLLHLLPGQAIPSAPKTNGTSQHVQQNGFTPPGSDASRSLNGGSPRHASVTEVNLSQLVPNGIGGTLGNGANTLSSVP